MKREDRYEVLKCADIDAALSDSDKLLLSAVLSKIERYRKEQGKEPIRGLLSSMIGLNMNRSGR